MAIRMPRLLDQNLKETARLSPVKASATLNLSPISTASMTIRQDAPEVPLHAFIQLYDLEQSIGVFRVSSVRSTYTDHRQVEMESAVCTLEDDLTDSGLVLNGSMSSVLATLLSYQTTKRWQLGAVESTEEIANIEADHVNLLEALIKIVAIDKNAAIELDYNTTPWTLNVRMMPDTVSCESRLNRNLHGVTVTLDDSRLCTRVTAVPQDGEPVTLDSDTIGIYGVVHRAISVDEGKDPTEEARAYLDENKKPALSIELDARMLAQITGDPFDSFGLGYMCRMTLPAFNAVFDERILSIEYTDLYADPGHVRLTMSSTVSDASSAIASLRKETQKNSQGVSNAFKHIKETDNRVEINAEEIQLRATKEEVNNFRNDVYIELDAEKAQIALHAEHLDFIDETVNNVGIRIDGINARIDLEAERIDKANDLISSANLAIDGANARIDAEAKRIDEANGEITSAKLAIDGANAAITAEVTRATEAEGVLSGRLTVTTEAITAEVTRATGAETELAGRIKITEDSITAQAGTIDAQGKLIEGAQTKIDGLNKTITDVAGSVDTLTGTLSGVQTKLDGVEKTVTTQAGTIDAQGKLIEGAQQTIDGLKGEISQKVSKNGLISEINQSAEEIKISASKVNLVGYVTAEYLQAHYVEADEISSFVTGEIDLERVNADSGSIMSLYCDSLTVNSWPVDMGTHFHTFTANADGTVTIGGPSATAGSFNIADTQFYKDGVSAAKDQVTVSGSWSGGAYTAKTNAPHPRSASTFISGTATGTYNETTHQYDISAPVNYSAGPGSAGGGSTGYTITGTTGTEAYSAGAKSVYVEKQSWSNPAQGYVRCEITLSNGVTRGWSKQVPSSWM